MDAGLMECASLMSDSLIRWANFDNFRVKRELPVLRERRSSERGHKTLDFKQKLIWLLK